MQQQTELPTQETDALPGIPCLLTHKRKHNSHHYTRQLRKLTRKESKIGRKAAPHYKTAFLL